MPSTPQPAPGFDANLQAYYAARAREYDAVYRKPERQADLCSVQAWLAPQFVGARVLEVACGTGYWTQCIATTATKVLGLDAEEETLQIARTRGLGPQVQWALGDAYALPATPAAFDAAFAGFWFSHILRARRTAFFQSLHAALPKGASVVLLDNRFVAGSSTPIAETDAAGDSWQLRPLADGSQHRVLKNFPAEEELHAAVQAAGAGRGTFTQWPYFWAYGYSAPGADI